MGVTGESRRGGEGGGRGRDVDEDRPNIDRLQCDETHSSHERNLRFFWA